LDVALRALGLEELLELVVAVAFGRHRPELADDGDLRLHAGLVDLDRAEDRLALPERNHDVRLLRERVVDDLLALLELRGGVALDRLVGPHAVAVDVEHVADDHALEERPEERRVELETELLPGRLLEAAGLLKEEH